MPTSFNVEPGPSTIWLSHAVAVSRDDEWAFGPSEYSNHEADAVVQLPTPIVQTGSSAMLGVHPDGVSDMRCFNERDIV